MALRGVPAIVVRYEMREADHKESYPPVGHRILSNEVEECDDEPQTDQVEPQASAVQVVHAELAAEVCAVGLAAVEQSVVISVVVGVDVEVVAGLDARPVKLVDYADQLVDAV